MDAAVHQKVRCPRDHVLIFHGARTGNEGEGSRADPGLFQPHRGIIRLHFPAGELVRLRDANELQNAGQHFQGTRIDGSDVTRDADGRARGAGHRMGSEIHAANGFENLVDLLRGGLAIHYDEHTLSPVSPAVNPAREPLDGSPVSPEVHPGTLRKSRSVKSSCNSAVWVNCSTADFAARAHASKDTVALLPPNVCFKRSRPKRLFLSGDRASVKPSV